SRYPDGYPDGAGVSDSEHRGEERTSREPEQVGEYGDQPYQPDRNVHWEGGSHRQRNTPRQNNPYHAEAEHHHHHYGPETRNSPRRADDTGRYGGGGGAEAEYVCHAGVGRRD
ncbi:unnamed protein product, partial [Pylaiella littoralis]